MDDFEICCPVKSKANIHKICGVYFQIRNLPLSISAKIDNIFLIALATSSDLKDNEGLNDLNELVVEELAKLENIGFKSTDGKAWKAVLVNISCDNLGANTLFGFSKGFNANFYCRICSMNREECECSVKEIPDKLRSNASHQRNIELIKENPATKLKDSEGVRMECIYNKLENYDIFNNASLDIMHDVHEGIIPSFLETFFNYCIRNKIETEQEIIRMIRDFNYSALFQKTKPSLLSFTKSHFGQNATQAHCLILHMPFIFYHLKHKLCKIWPALEQLLQIIQIIMSAKIKESDLTQLEKNITTYLNDILKLKERLIPKEHLLTHYPSIIRKVGPLKHSWTMRFECKHKYFTDAAKLTTNFININKTLASKHQEQICLKKYSIQSNIVQSKKPKLFSEHCEFAKYESFLTSVNKNINFEHLFVLSFLNFNSFSYKKGLVIIENGVVYDILFVLKSNNDYYFLCELYETALVDRSLNSIQVQPYSPEQQLAYLKHNDLSNLQSFSKITCGGKIYVIAENLSVFNSSNEHDTHNA